TWLERQEDGALLSAAGDTNQVDPGGVEVPAAVPVHVHAHLDLPDELHKVDGLLPETIASVKEHPRRRRVEPLPVADQAVSALVDAPAAGEEGHRARVGACDLVGADRAEPVSGRVNRDGGDALVGQLGGHEPTGPLVAARTMRVDGHGVASCGL